jgi:VanZ family protein
MRCLRSPERNQDQQVMKNPMQQERGRKQTSSRAYGFVLLLVILVILYGSLFPFVFQERSFPGGAFFYLLSTWRVWDGRGDLLANILLYMPFGFFAVNAIRPRSHAVSRFFLALIGGVLLSGGVEMAQFNDAGRVTSMGDVYANAIGAAVGALVGVLLDRSWRWPFVGELAATPAETLLLTMFFAYRLFPYVPVIDLHKYWHAVRPMLLTPSMPPEEFFRYLVTWLFIAALVDALYGWRRFLFLFPLLCGLEFAGKVIIIGAELKLNDLLSAAVAWVIWIVLLRLRSGKFVLLASVFAAMIAIDRLQPFRFEAAPHAFGWVPFGSFMRGSIAVDIQAFCQKFYEYGGLIWLLHRGGMRLRAGTLLTASLLLATSFAERWLPGRSAEITDAIMALILGGMFAVLRERIHPTPAAAWSTTAHELNGNEARK